jgi:hypothetical protein
MAKQTMSAMCAFAVSIVGFLVIFFGGKKKAESTDTTVC